MNNKKYKQNAWDVVFDLQTCTNEKSNRTQPNDGVENFIKDMHRKYYPIIPYSMFRQKVKEWKN